MKLVLTAPDGTMSLSVPGGSDRTTVRLAADDESTIPLGVVFYDGGATITILKTETDGKSLLVDLPFSGQKAKYRATIPGDDAAGSDIVTAESDGADNDVAEVSIGQYDWPFSLIAGVLLAVLAGGILVLAGLAIAAVFQAGIITTINDDTTTTRSTETIVERVRAVVMIGLFATGSILVLLGGMMALLETRGRLRHRENQAARAPRVNDTSHGNFGAHSLDAVPSSTVPVDKLLESGSKAFEKTVGAASRARGTVVTLVIGLVILLVAFLGSSTIDFSIEVGDSGTPSEEPIDQPTPTPSPSST